MESYVPEWAGWLLFVLILLNGRHTYPNYWGKISELEEKIGELEERISELEDNADDSYDED
jgi:hypothetical protein